MAKKNNKSIATLIKISKNEVDTKQKELAEIQRQQDFFLHHIDIMQQSIAHEKKILEENFDQPDLAASYAKFAAATNEKISIARTQVEQLEKQILKKRDELSEAFSEQKKFEIVQAAKLHEQKKEEEKKLSTQLDEAGTNMFIRNLANSEFIE